MHPSISLMLNQPRYRAAIERALARRGQHGDTILAHINPAEAALLKRLGGVGTVNPRTGLPQFWEDGGGGMGNSQGHAGGNGIAGGDGGKGGDGGRPGDGPGGYDGQGRGWGGAGDGTTGGDLGPGQTRSGESAFQAATNDYNDSLLGQIFGAKPNLANSASYADGTWHTGFNPGSVIGGAIGTAFGIPGLGLIGGWGYHELGGTDVVLGGPGAPPGEGMMKGMGFGPNPYGGGSTGIANGAGAIGSGRHDDRQNSGRWPGTAGLPGHQPPGSEGAAPAPGAMPAGLPPAAHPALAGLYLGGLAGDPFAGRFGFNPGLSPYLIAASQPAGPGYLSGVRH